MIATPHDGVDAGELLFLSGIRGQDPRTHEYSPDTKTQAGHAFESLKRLLTARGLTLRHVVKVTMFLEDLAYRDVLHPVWVEYFPKDPPARIALQIVDAAGGPSEAGAHFVLDVIALARPYGTFERETLEDPTRGPRGMKSMVAAVKGGGYVFFSAVRGRDPATKSFSDDPREQARHALESVKATLEHRGLALRHVVKVTLFMNDLEYRNPFHEVWKEYFPQDPPARTALRVVNANASPRGKAHFVLDVIALAS